MMCREYVGILTAQKQHRLHCHLMLTQISCTLCSVSAKHDVLVEFPDI